MALIRTCRIEAYHRDLPPALIAQRLEGRGDCWLIHLELDSGIRGSGDIAPWPGFGSDISTVSSELEMLTQTLVGQRIPSLEHVPAWLESLSDEPAIRHGLEGALLGCLSGASGTPVATFLWSVREVGIPVHALVDTPEEASRLLETGVQLLKMKIGGSVVEDVERVRSMRRRHPCARLRLDANGRWTRDQTATFLEAVGDVEHLIVEQPVAAEDFAAFGWLKARTPVTLAVDEGVVVSAEQAIADPAIDQLVLKPMFLGGILAAAALAQQAIAQEKGICITHALESAVGRHHALALAALHFEDGPHGVASRHDSLVDGCIAYPPRSVLGAAV